MSRLFSLVNSTIRRTPSHRTPARAVSKTIRWQPSPLPLLCELSSSHDEAMQRARQIFAPSLDSPSLDSPCDATIVCTSRWRIERGANRLWRALRLETNETLENADLDLILTHIEYSIVGALVELVKNDVQSGIFAIHGALLRRNGFTLVIVGASEAGKSTLTCALWQNGWTVCSDDFCFIRGENQVFPAARRVSLRNGSRALLGETLWRKIENAPSSFQTGEGWLFHPHEIEEKSAAPTDAARRDAMNIDAILFLRRRDESKIDELKTSEKQVAQRCNAARAALTLLPYCTLSPRDDETNDATSNNDAASNRVLDWGGALPKIAPLASRVPFYSLQRDELLQMVRAVETLRETP